MDRYTAEYRSHLMSRICGKDTKPEKVVRSLLHHMGYRFRLHRRNLPGTPDVVLVSRKTVVLVHGCFWHQHKGCKDSGIPKSNTEFWLAKLKGNVERDRRHSTQLKKMGWRVIKVWECETTNLNALERRLAVELSVKKV